MLPDAGKRSLQELNFSAVFQIGQQLNRSALRYGRQRSHPSWVFSAAAAAFLPSDRRSFGKKIETIWPIRPGFLPVFEQSDSMQVLVQFSVFNS